MFLLLCSNPASFSAVLNSVSKYHSHLIQISLLYKSLPLFSLGSCFANSIIFYVYPPSSVLILLFLFLCSLPDQFLHPAPHSVLRSCSSFTRLLIPLCYFLLAVSRFYCFCMRCRGLVFACNLDVLLLSRCRLVVTCLCSFIPLGRPEVCVLAYCRNRARYSFSEI